MLPPARVSYSVGHYSSLGQLNFGDSIGDPMRSRLALGLSSHFHFVHYNYVNNRERLTTNCDVLDGRRTF